MMEFKALRVATLTEEVATNLDSLLSNLPGIKQFAITLENKEMRIVFDEHQLDFQALAREIAKAGCPLWSINAALLVAEPSPKSKSG